jgi:hypothetical protein
MKEAKQLLWTHESGMSLDKVHSSGLGPEISQELIADHFCHYPIPVATLIRVAGLIAEPTLKKRGVFLGGKISVNRLDRSLELDNFSQYHFSHVFILAEKWQATISEDKTTFAGLCRRPSTGLRWPSTNPLCPY